MSKLQIGWGRREISIREQVEIPGQMYMRISNEILDPLYATALAVSEEGGETVIFCSMDLGNFNTGLLDLILEKVRDACPDLPADHIVFNCTHTHTCPQTRNGAEVSPDGRSLFPGAKYRDYCSTRASEAIIEAFQNLKPGGMAYGYGYAVVAHSRRVTFSEDMSLYTKGVPIAPNGHAIMYGKTNREQFLGYEAGADHFLNLMFTTDEEDKLTGIVVNVPCPSQVTEAQSIQSADYWGNVREEVAKEYGDKVFVLPQCAAAGDLSPRILHYLPAQARRMKLKYGLDYPEDATVRNMDRVMGERKDIASRIMEGIRDVYAWAMKDVRHDAAVKMLRIDQEITARKVTLEEKKWCEENVEKLKAAIPEKEGADPDEYLRAITTYNSIKARNMGIVEKYEKQAEHPVIGTRIFAVRIGDIAFATNRYELYMDYMHRIQARSPFIQTFVVQLAGDEYGGYLPTKRGYENKGYSASMFDNRVSYEGGQEIVELTLEALSKLSDESCEK